MHGDPSPLPHGRNALYSVMSFLDCTKSPSLLSPLMNRPVALQYDLLPVCHAREPPDNLFQIVDRQQFSAPARQTLWVLFLQEFNQVLPNVAA